MRLPKQFISCDWGTSNFRIRLVDFHSLQILAEHQTNVGVSNLYKEFKEQTKHTQRRFFANYLLDQIEQILPIIEEEVLIVASGMITSSLGMSELEYAQMPISFTGKEIVRLSLSINDKVNTLLISGMKTDNDVMRGEEIQAIGLVKYLSKEAQGILLLPGTHSKHIIFRNNKFEDFTTYMTGELFEIMAKHSIISESLEKSDWTPHFHDVFLNGVKRGIENQLMASCFSIRVNSLLQKITKKENYYYLSGLLIGSEVGYLKNTDNKIYLASSGILNELYKLALTSFIPSEQLVCFESEIINNALVAGHKKIVEAYV
ncbi:2-dehydro-3-deoxygalactonokinase [Aquimarina algiphila]|uniref:2-dehydro-3-deoxygalactonokinase n=1 Tax=Aquimarina algiphila TaxID=2047982 RepID=UPI00232B96A1|nr:2-dehydro-3-deoxygalactonokinase [Aquimarina algiphila]